MKTTVKRLIRDEKGAAMTLALLLLVLGGLVLTPLLGLMSTGLVAGQVFEKKTDELYAADAGVENAIWYLQHGGDPNDVLEFTMNGRNVTVEMEELPHACHEAAIFEITSTATSADGSSTTVLADVTNLYLFAETGQLTEGEIIATSVYAPGDLIVDNDAQIQGHAIVVGNLVLNECSLIGGVVCVGGDLTMNAQAVVESDVYVVGNLLMMGGGLGSQINGDTHVRGDVEMQGKAAINGTLWGGSSVTGGVQVDHNAQIMGDVHVRFLEVVQGSGTYGDIYEDYYDHGCPLSFAPPEILVWVII
jgi:cytoskeletal protein CcmA (bactofilin family)/Flp pilus assembly pilin Flp